ncbi:hypothetical protein PAI11_37580 [Patulibacter medicamentivorans]|uniref:Uncharacterized protein n=1 Tax=Patulibacter medicamentivorans TaxID=1097667 RepID=H0EA84_9ACTN|nr:hypothetical protein [Patulibacter medicamentivorans]EHN09424.1 hypothetical protein PAI11_37580 [Patulibacter medicamentivorans]
MSEHVKVVLDGETIDLPPAATTEPSADADADRPAAGSLLGSLVQTAEQVADADEKVLRIGKQDLHARYRVLRDHERQSLEQTAKQQIKLREKITGEQLRDLERETEVHALLIATACIDVGVLDANGNYQPLHEALAVADDELDRNIAPDGPLRFNAELAALILPGFTGESGGKPSSIEVVKRMHLWSGTYAAVRTTGRLLDMWMSTASSRAITETLEGN